MYFLKMNYSAIRPNGSQPFSLSAGSAAELSPVGIGNVYDIGAIAVAEYSFFSRRKVITLG